MRSLAEFIMSGRWQAAIIAVIGIPIISPAASALITLRKGSAEGNWVLLALVFPAVVWLVMDFAKALMLALIVRLALMHIAGMFLREFRSWSIVLALVAFLSTVGVNIAHWSFDMKLSLLQLADYAGMSEINRIELEKNLDLALNQKVIVPELAFWVGVAAISSLFLARHWQAELFNPGGFREEFQNLRIDTRMVVLMLVLSVGFASLPNTEGSPLIVVLPLFFAGLGYIHWLSNYKRINWLLWLVYPGLLLPPWGWAAIMAVGLLDSLFNLRKKVSKNGE